jgi:hypothetical protein
MSIVLANLPSSIVVTNLLTGPTVAGNLVLPPGATTIVLTDASPAYKSQIWLQLTQLELAGFISCSPHTQTLLNPATGPQEPPYTQAPADAGGQTYEPADPSDWTTIISAIPTTVAVALDLLAAAVLAGGGGGGFNPHSPGPIGDTTPSTGAFTAITIGTAAHLDGTLPGLSFNDVGTIAWSATSGYSTAKDTSLSRNGAGVVAVGTGATGSTDGELEAQYVRITGAASALTILDRSTSAGWELYSGGGSFGIYSGALGQNVLTIDGNGSFLISTGTVTSDDPALLITQTWNNSSDTFHGLVVNITNTASNSASLVFELQNSGSTIFGIDTSGNITTSDTIGCNNLNTYPNSGRIGVAVNYDGDQTGGNAPMFYGIQTWNNAATDFVGIFTDVTITACASSSFLMVLQVNGSPKLSVDQYGNVQSQGNLYAGNNNTYVLGTGQFQVNDPTVTASTPMLNLVQTWNNSAVAFTAGLINVNNTASLSYSRLLDLQVGGASKLNVDILGQLNTANNAFIGGEVVSVGNNLSSYKDPTPTFAVSCGMYSFASSVLTNVANFDFYNGSSWSNAAQYDQTTFYFNIPVLLGAGLQFDGANNWVLAVSGSSLAVTDASTSTTTFTFAPGYCTSAGVMGAPQYVVDASGGAVAYRPIYWRTAYTERWGWVCNNDAESGGDTGSSISLDAYDDAGTYIDSPITMARAAGSDIVFGGGGRRIYIQPKSGLAYLDVAGGSAPLVICASGVPLIPGGTVRPYASTGQDLGDLTTNAWQDLYQTGARYAGITAVQTSAYGVGAHDHTVLCDATGGSFIVTLPVPPVAGQIVVVKKTTTLNIVTVEGQSGALVDGGATTSLTGMGFASYQYDGTNWWVVA